MTHPINNLDQLFESALIDNTDVEDVLVDDDEDNVFGYLEENRKISIFDADYILEGEQ